MKKRFGKDEPAPTREDLEREAARELERMTRQAGGPGSSGGPSGWSSPPPQGPAPSTAPDRGWQSSQPPPRSSFGSGFSGGAPAAPSQPSVRERFESRDREEADDDDDYTEEEMVTELALRDWSERSGRGRSIEDLALPRLDAQSIEAQRDRALREFTERQARMERESQAARIQRQAMGLAPPSRANTVNVTAARPMGMLNLSAQAAGMRGQAPPSGVADRFKAKEGKAPAKPAAGKAADPKPKKPRAPAARKSGSTLAAVGSTVARPMPMASGGKAAISKVEPKSVVRSTSRKQVPEASPKPAGKATPKAATSKVGPKTVRRAVSRAEGPGAAAAEAAPQRAARATSKAAATRPTARAKKPAGEPARATSAAKAGRAPTKKATIVTSPAKPGKPSAKAVPSVPGRAKKAAPTAGSPEKKKGSGRR